MSKVSQEKDFQNIDDQVKENLEYFVRDYKIFVDTCSLMHPKFRKFAELIEPALIKFNNKLTVGKVQCDEIIKHQKSKDPTTRKRAIEAAKVINRLIHLNLLEVRNDPRDDFADNVYLTYIIKYQLQYNILLITQDNGLAHDVIEKVGNFDSVKTSKKSTARRINDFGHLAKYQWLKDEEELKNQVKQQNQNSSKKPSPAKTDTPNPKKAKPNNQAPKAKTQPKNDTNPKTSKPTLKPNPNNAQAKENHAPNKPQKPQGQETKALQGKHTQNEQKGSSARDLGPSRASNNSSNKSIQKPAPKVASKAPIKNTPKSENSQAFRIFQNITSINDDVLLVAHYPEEGDLIYTDAGPLNLRQKIAQGGEGAVYATDTAYVAKIYKPANNTMRRYEKIKRMLEHKLSCKGICFPVSKILNADHQFVGYLMPKAQGKTLQQTLLCKKKFLKDFPEWKKQDLIELCLTILKKIEYLHQHNIIIGDLNLSNILMVSPTEVYFVDTDSYQIEDLPCPVGTVPYTAPEIQKRNFSEFLRTLGNENFAVATLLFMIMLPGKTPYAQQGGEDQISNILSMDFPYPFAGQSNKRSPEGPWRYIWSHLSYDLKECFYNTFMKGGKYSTENQRLSAKQWIEHFHLYANSLSSMLKIDPMSGEIYPTRLKKLKDVEYVTCKICGEEVDPKYLTEGICSNCLKATIEFRPCKRCGQPVAYTNWDKYIKDKNKSDGNKRPPLYCPKCFSERNQVVYSVTCVECGKSFEIKRSEIEDFKERGWQLPKRCPDCRIKNNPNKSSGSNTHSQNTPQPQGGSILKALGKFFGFNW